MMMMMVVLLLQIASGAVFLVRLFDGKGLYLLQWEGGQWGKEAVIDLCCCYSFFW